MIKLSHVMQNVDQICRNIMCPETLWFIVTMIYQC